MTKKISELTPAEQRELVRLWNNLDQWAAERRAAELRDFIHTRVKQLYSEGRSVEAIADVSGLTIAEVNYIIFKAL